MTPRDSLLAIRSQVRRIYSSLGSPARPMLWPDGAIDLI